MKNDFKKIENDLDILLVLLYAPGKSGENYEEIKGITRLQKLLFLLWKESKFSESIPNLYGFEAYDYGPCLDDIYDDLNFAEAIGLIEVKEVPSGNDYEDIDEEIFLKDFGFEIQKKGIRRDYKLSPKGSEAAKEMFQAMGNADRDSLIRIKKKYNSVPFFKLLQYVYQKYPEFARKSILSL